MASWAKQLNSELPKALLRTLAMEKSAIEFAQRQRGITLRDWVEMELILQFLQRGLINWFDQQAYDVKAGQSCPFPLF